jgi:alkanesulfonate monooxygenase
MAVEFVGMIGTRSASELDGPSANLIGGHVDRDFVKRFAQAHENSGFDKVLVGYGSTGPDGFMVASYAGAHTDRVAFLLAHRPGFVVPTLAARKIATLDQFLEGRLAVHIITGGSDQEQQRDGDFLSHDERYERTNEYLEVMRRVWSEERPFDYAGKHYQFAGAYSEVKPYQRPFPVYFGGMSEAALDVGARHCDVFMMWGEPLASVKAQIEQVRPAAAKYGREPRFSVSTRPILGATEEQAWERAHDILERVKAVRRPSANGEKPRPRPQAIGSQRLLELAAKGELHDRCLWTPIAEAVGAYGNTTALVGTPETVAAALLDYYDLGVTTLLIRGFEPLEDAIEYGKELIPLVRAGVAERERKLAAVGSAARTAISGRPF